MDGFIAEARRGRSEMREKGEGDLCSWRNNWLRESRSRMANGWLIAGAVVLLVLVADGCASKRAPLQSGARESTTSVTRAESGIGTAAPSTKPSSKPSSRPSVVATTQEAPFVKLWNGQ